MYTPKYFAIEDRAALFQFMKANSFVCLVTTDANATPFATHIPIIVDEANNLLVAHIARANPQWKHFDEQKEALVIFQGAHSYISSLWYESPDDVSTWNYTAVHVYGVVKIIDDNDRIIELLRTLNHNYDGDEGAQHFDQLNTSFRDALMKGIVAFEISISRIEGNYKLSQNRSVSERGSVMKHLEQSDDIGSRDVATLMRNLHQPSDL